MHDQAVLLYTDDPQPLPRRDKLYLRACPRCGGAVRYQQLSDNQYELKCLACGRNYEHRLSSVVHEVAVDLERDLRNERASSGYHLGDRETRRKKVFEIIRTNPGITPSELSKMLDCSFESGRYWIRRYQAVGSRYDPPSKLAG